MKKVRMPIIKKRSVTVLSTKKSVPNQGSKNTEQREWESLPNLGVRPGFIILKFNGFVPITFT